MRNKKQHDYIAVRAAARKNDDTISRITGAINGGCEAQAGARSSARTLCFAQGGSILRNR